MTEDERRKAVLFNDVTHALNRTYVPLNERHALANYLWEQGWRRDVRPEDVTEADDWASLVNRRSVEDVRDLFEKNRIADSHKHDWVERGSGPDDRWIECWLCGTTRDAATWTELFGMTADFTGGQDVDEFLEESRGEA